MEIKASSTFDYDTMKKFCRFAYFKRGRFWVMMSLLLIMAIPVYIISLNYIINYLYYGYLPLMIVITVIIVLYIINCLFIAPKLVYKRLGKYKDLRNDFVFKDESFVVSSECEGYSGNDEQTYSTLDRAYETSDFYYLFRTSSQSFAVDKSTVENGTCEEISRVLSEALGKKFKVK